MAIDYSKVAFHSGLKYMRKYSDHTLGSGGGSITHGLGYVPFFLVYAIHTSSLVPIRSGIVQLPGLDAASYVIDATTSVVTVTEDLPPTSPATYFIRVYEDPLP